MARRRRYLIWGAAKPKRATGGVSTSPVKLPVGVTVARADKVGESVTTDTGTIVLAKSGNVVRVEVGEDAEIVNLVPGASLNLKPVFARS